MRVDQARPGALRQTGSTVPACVFTVCTDQMEAPSLSQQQHLTEEAEPRQRPHLPVLTCHTGGGTRMFYPGILDSKIREWNYYTVQRRVWNSCNCQTVLKLPCLQGALLEMGIITLYSPYCTS